MGFYTSKHTLHNIPRGQCIPSGTVRDFKMLLQNDQFILNISHLNNFSKSDSVSIDSSLVKNGSISAIHTATVKKLTNLHKPKNFESAISKIQEGRVLREKLKADKAQTELRSGEDLTKAGTKSLSVTKCQEFSFLTEQRVKEKTVTFRPQPMKSPYDTLAYDQEQRLDITLSSSTKKSKMGTVNVNATKPVEFSFSTDQRVKRRQLLSDAVLLREQKDQKRQVLLKNQAKEILKQVAINKAVQVGTYSNRSTKERQDEIFRKYAGEDPLLQTRYEEYYSHYSYSKATPVRSSTSISGLSFALSDITK
jgi:hypothetical protein